MIIIFNINFNSEFILAYFVPNPNHGTRTTNDTYVKSYMLASSQSNDFVVGDITVFFNKHFLIIIKIIYG